MLKKTPAEKENRKRKQEEGKKEKANSILKSGTSVRNKEFAVITYSFLVLFFATIGYFVYFQIFKSEEFINNTYNTRQETYEKSVTRGEILSSTGAVLAETVSDSAGKESRSYPYGRMFSHIVGYNTTDHGRSGLESWANFNLLRSNTNLVEKAVDDVTAEKYIGDNVYTTLDENLQETAYDALGNHEGAVIVMEPKTGKVLAIVSKPDFDPNTISADWDTIIADENSESPLLNRATQGLYPPGSTFKTITALEYLRENSDYEKYSYKCTGTLTVNSSKISCYNGERHGTESLISSYANSCNCSFANIGLTLNLSSLAETAKSMLFNTKLPVVSMDTKKSSYVLKDGSGTSEIMETAIGQGQTVVTPIHMLMIASAIANNGVLMEPYVIDHTATYDGSSVKTEDPVEYGALMTTDEAGVLQEFMKKVVTSGTATKLAKQSYTAAGKTGSAEYGTVKGDSHAWFVGYASREDKNDIAIAVIVEGAGIGSEYAVPVAKKVFDQYYQ